MRRTLTTDIAVIGSGPGGSVTATACAQAGRSVILLEEGSHLALESAPHFSREEILQKYRNAAINVAFGQSKTAYVEGRCVGGGSEINRGIYHRLPDSVRESWAREFAVDGFSAAELEPHFDACEAVARVQYLPGKAPALSLRLQRGAAALGWDCAEAPRLFDYADRRTPGSLGRKQSMSETFVPRFLDAGGRLIADARAQRIRRESGKWHVSVRHEPPGETPSELQIVADTVFVACGAIHTPALLRRSGIKRNIGNSLRLHPMLKVVAVFDDELNTPGDLEPVHQIKHFDPRFSMGCSISKRPALAMAMIPFPEQIAEVDRNWRRMAIYYVQSTGARGSIRNLPGLRDPLVFVQQSAQDLAELAEGLSRLAEVLFAAGARTIYPSLPGYPVLRSADDIARLPTSLPPDRASTTTMHLFSSCPMGEGECCATDSFGRVVGVPGLRIADASLLCGPTVVNPQGTVMAVAHRNVQQFLGERRGHSTRAQPQLVSVE